MDLEAFDYWAEDDSRTGHALQHFPCNDHKLKSLSYSFRRCVVVLFPCVLSSHTTAKMTAARACRDVLGEKTMRSEGRANMLEVLEVLPLPMARAILRGAGDKQKSDMHRYYLQKKEILAKLEEIGERNARRDERRFRFHDCCGPEYELAVLARLRVGRRGECA